MSVGSGHPSLTAISGASAHPPQAPIWLDPSGCPPGRVFSFLKGRTMMVRAQPLRRRTCEVLDFFRVFHKIYRSCLSDSYWLRPRLPHCGQIYGISNGRSQRPRNHRALVQSRGTAAQIPHRIVRQWKVAPFPQRGGVSREYSGGQDGGGDLARSIVSRGLARQQAIDLSWLGRSGTLLPLNEFRRGRAALPRVAKVPAEPPQKIAVLAEDKDIVGEPTGTGPLGEDAWAAVLDLATVAARYPLLRNTL